MPRPLALVLLATSLAASAQPGPRFDRLGTDDGLSQSIVNAVLQDRQGYLWFGTEDGLNRYDGARFAVYRYVPDDSTALPGNRVTALAEDGSGALWVGTTTGLARFSRGKETFSRPPGAPGDPDGVCGTDVTALAVGADGTLWTATRNGGLCARDAETNAFERAEVQPVPQQQPGALALVRGARGTLWAHLTGLGEGATASICRLDETDRTCEIPADIPWTHSVAGAPGVAFGQTSDGLAMYRAEGDAWTRAQLWPGVRMAGGSSPLLATSGRVWVGTEADGILDVDPEAGDARFYTPDPADPRSVSAAGVRTFYRDAQGSVWIGTELGLSRWRPPETGAFQVILRGPGGLASGANGIEIAQDGTVWIATNDGLHRLDPETGAVEIFRRNAAPDESFASAFWWVGEAGDGTFWVGAKRQGLFRFDPATGAFSREPGVTGALFGGSDSPRVPVRHIYTDPDGRVWLGTSDGLAVRPAVTGEWRGFTPASDELPSTHVNVVLEAEDGTMWVGTDGGLCRFVPGMLGEIRALTCDRHVPGDPASLGADIVWTVAEDADGRLWAGTIGGGLAGWNPDEENWTRVTTADGLPNNTIYGLLPDAAGRLWMTTNAGLAAYDTRTGDVSIYTVADGLPSNEFDFMAYGQGADERMVVGGPHGLATFVPDRLAPSDEAVPVVVSSVIAGDVRRPGLLESGARVEVAHDEGYLRFEFASLDYRNPEENRYQYRLRGYEETWRETDGRQPFAVYTRVPPGSYTFELRGANRDGVFNPVPVEIDVTVVPAWWQAWWLRLLLGGLVLGGLAVLANRLHENRLRRERLEDLRLQRRIAQRIHSGPVPALRRAGDDLAALAGDDAAHPAHSVRTTVVEATEGLVTVIEELGPPDWEDTRREA
ncbi:MAG: two-component regulator propeller domain-containing protein [Bacteroidota bacterium]